jgi:hypothetical protein
MLPSLTAVPWDPSTAAPVGPGRPVVSIAADAQRARAHTRRVSLRESVQRSGLGRPSAELELEALR